MAYLSRNSLPGVALVDDHSHVVLEILVVGNSHALLLHDLVILKGLSLLLVLVNSIRVDLNVLSLIKERNDLLHGLEILVVVKVVALHVSHLLVEVALDSHVLVRNALDLVFLVLVVDASALVHFFLVELDGLLRDVVLLSQLVLSAGGEHVLVPVVLLAWGLTEVKEFTDEHESQLLVIGLLLELKIEDVVDELEEVLTLW